ncbi:MAG: hypothetical protein QOF20_2654 [Acidimicrobiaceae bacterium]|jgi:hypothetical protein|nr:hypothetical protein [Acidimicrobiaceae bacterium]MDQ1370301.1 hypothetical protein [Acidimicrobiaceae bacterium]MDQ1441318.1 hypothetical protein [Acidimicrobiaceae bacterium]
MPDPSDADADATADSTAPALDLDDPAAELRLVEQELADLRGEADELRREIGDPGEAPGDQAARANLITSLEMTEAVIETLEARTETLRQRLGK